MTVIIHTVTDPIMEVPFPPPSHLFKSTSQTSPNLMSGRKRIMKFEDGVEQRVEKDHSLNNISFLRPVPLYYFLNPEMEHIIALNSQPNFN